MHCNELCTSCWHTHTNRNSRCDPVSSRTQYIIYHTCDRQIRIRIIHVCVCVCLCLYVCVSCMCLCVSMAPSTVHRRLTLSGDGREVQPCGADVGRPDPTLQLIIALLTWLQPYRQKTTHQPSQESLLKHLLPAWWNVNGLTYASRQNHDNTYNITALQTWHNQLMIHHQHQLLNIWPTWTKHIYDRVRLYFKAVKI